jgi:hypothetical protein
LPLCAVWKVEAPDGIRTLTFKMCVRVRACRLAIQFIWVIQWIGLVVGTLYIVAALYVSHLTQSPPHELRELTRPLRLALVVDNLYSQYPPIHLELP